jgi:mono/diheme cytochrome c family protein
MKPLLLVTVVGVVGLLAGIVWQGLDDRQSGSATAETLTLGRQVYAAHCASYHGANLEGQPDWKRRLPSGRMSAPPHDASGHTWHHPDGVLFRITKEGPAAVVVGGYESDMPGFGDVLSDGEIRAVLEFIKSMWSERQRQYQAELSRREKDSRQ